MEPLKVKVILGSTRRNRFSELPGAWLMGELEKRSDMEVELLDLRDYPMPFFEEPVSPSSKTEPYTNEAVVRWTAKIAEADAYIIVAPEYNHGYPAVLKNALDYVYPEWNGKPVAFVTYGSAMGARTVEQLRLVAVELQMAPIRNAIHMPWSTVEEGRKASTTAFDGYAERVTGLADQLLWWGTALKRARTGA
jgi:NAD(P)H-dependent FMN reductase